MVGTGWNEARASAIIDQHKDEPGASLVILHALQNAFGYVDDSAVPAIAAALHLSRAEVHGIITFYHDFRRHPAGRHVVRLCRAEACQSVGSEALESHVKSRLGVDYHGTTVDQAITLEAVYCLGNCACGPSIQIDGKTHGRVSPQRFDRLMAGLAGS